MDKEESDSENPNLTNEVPEVRWPRFAALAFGAYAFVGGLTSFLGWAADLPRLTDWEGSGISIQPNTTVVVMATGAVLILINFGYRRIPAILGALVGLI